MENADISWGKIHDEFTKATQESLQLAAKTGVAPVIPIDGITQKYIDQLVAITQRPLLIYVTDFFNAQKVSMSNNEVSIILSDKDGIIEATKSLPAGPLDIIIHSPGGSLDATESIVDILRQKFTEIRFFIPNTAKSAATMLALSGDEIYLASSGELGPIDPQLVSRKSNGELSQSPAQAIIDQFEEAQKDLAAHPNKLPAWIPILPMYGPSLYQDSKNAMKLAKEIVRTWLIRYMFKSIPKKIDRTNRARKVVNYFADHSNLKSHGRRIGLTELDNNLKGLLKVKRLDDDPQLYDAVMAVYYCFIHIFLRSPAFKIIQNNIGNKYIRQVQIPQQVQLPRVIQPPQQPQQFIQ